MFQTDYWPECFKLFIGFDTFPFYTYPYSHHFYFSFQFERFYQRLRKCCVFKTSDLFQSRKLFFVVGTSGLKRVSRILFDVHYGTVFFYFSFLIFFPGTVQFMCLYSTVLFSVVKYLPRKIGIRMQSRCGTVCVQTSAHFEKIETHNTLESNWGIDIDMMVVQSFCSITVIERCFGKSKCTYKPCIDLVFFIYTHPIVD